MDAVVWDAGESDVVTCASPQALQIGEEIEVAVLSVEGGRVRLGITAPGRRLRTIDPIALPAGGPEMGLIGLERGASWPKGHGE